MPARLWPLPALFAVLSVLPIRTFARDATAALAEATEAFQRARAGDGSQAVRARDLFEELAAAAPRDPVILAYAGSAAVLVAREDRSPLQRMKGVDAGLDRIDLALRLLGPEHDRPAPGRLPPRVETLLVAASTFIAVPDPVFHRLQDGKALARRAIDDPSFPRLPAPVQARFHLLTADAARAERQPAAERAALQRALAADPSGPLAAPARARLAEVQP